jgi:ABC-type lipoprotein release transport system permease subunit
MIQLIKMAYRDLGRNRRRSFLSSLALGVGLALLLLMAAFVNGEMNSTLDNTIRLQSGHLQIRAQTYDETKSSLKWVDLVENPEPLIEQIASLPQVKAATPRLYASGIVSAMNKSSGVRVFGIDPLSPANAPYSEGIVNGEYLSADDRQGVLIGQPLAEKLELSTGDQVMLSVNTSNGDVDEQLFTIRGIYSTQTYGFDSSTIFLPLGKAQAITQTENHASAIFVLLQERDQTDEVVAAMQTSKYEILTWTEMNELILQTEELSNAYMSLLYLIVLGITATVIVNTLVMAVYERTREIGILSAIGMKSGRIMALFLAESTLLAIGGILIGLVLGSLVVGYLSKYGFYIGNMGITGLLIENRIYTDPTLEDTLSLSLIALVITLIAGLYPAILATRLEPVDALRAGQ